MLLRNNCHQLLFRHFGTVLLNDFATNGRCLSVLLTDGQRSISSYRIGKTIQSSSIRRSSSSSSSTAGAASTTTASIGKITTSTRHKATYAPPPLFEGNVKSPVVVRSPQPFRLPPNMSFNYCTMAEDTVPETGPTYELYRNDSSSSQVATVATRPLVVLFAWMLAKENHIEKYRQFWYQRGFDVLSVKTSPLDLLLPTVGGARNSENVYRFLSQIRPRYDEVLIHAFSVGGFQFCEVCKYLNESNNRDNQTVFDSFRGLITDSFVYPHDCAPGLSRAITHNPIVQPLIESSLANFLKITKSFTMNRYLEVFSILKENERRIPCLSLYSKDDVVSNYKMSDKLTTSWQKKGILSRSKCWDSSVHVLHYREHPDEYEQEVDSFVEKLNINKNRTTQQ